MSEFKAFPIPQLTADDYERDFSDRHLLDEALANWAEEKAGDTALISAENGNEITWEQFEQATTAIAVKLLDMGFEKGDVFATALPMIPEHVLLYYGCLKIGALMLELDPEMDAEAMRQAIEHMQAKAFAFSASPTFDASSLPCVRSWLQFGADASSFAAAENGASFIEGARDFARSEHAKGMDSEILNTFTMRGMELDEEDPALAVYVDIENGTPRIAQLSHQAISCQNMNLGSALGLQQNSRLLATPLPCGLSLLLHITSAVFWGKTAVLLPSFDAAAIEKYAVDTLLLLPEQLETLWNSKKDLHVQTACCLSVPQDPDFTENLKTFAAIAGYGLALSETAGLCACAVDNQTPFESMPVCAASVREAMAADGQAGAEVAEQNDGQLCFSGLQLFSGYYQNDSATKARRSSDKVLYSGFQAKRQADGFLLKS